jgi:hypothetical protein
MKTLREWLVVLCAVLVLACVVGSAHADTPTLTQRMHAELVQLPAWYGDIKGWCVNKSKPNERCFDAEDPANREQRLLDIASAISSGTSHAMCTGAWKNDPDCSVRWRGSQRELAAALIALGYGESNFSSAIHLETDCGALPYGCDRDHRGAPRARGYWQCWRSACPHLWQTDPGSDAELRTAAWDAATLLAGFYAYCGTQGSEDRWEMAFTAYGGHGCRVRGRAPERRASMLRILRKL